MRTFESSETLAAVDAIVRVEAFRDLDAETLAADGRIAQVECALAPA